MSIVQWLVLALVILVVAGAYWYIRRQGGGDPWRDMEEPADGAGHDEPASGDSYVVGVRTLNKETPADRKAAAEAARARQAEQASEQTPEADRTRAVRQPTAVRRRAVSRTTAVSTDDKPSQGETQVRSSEAEPPRGADSTEPNEPEQTTVTTEIPPAATERVEMVAPERSEHSQLFMLYVAAPEGQTFDGPDIHAALAKADLKFGLNDLYHRVTEVHGVTESVFCVANMLKPGTLDPVDQDQLSTPGLTLFLLVPAPIEGRPAMRDMMETANRIATALGGHVLDDNRALLKAQTAQYMLDQIAEIDRRARLGQRRR
ncbi:cell division protein ZipA [Salinisphaera hydrothermalis]|uniref:Cell division protein ZipA n=1 Tax=Salinisphaera hydrothermalis (strain C41B8) TaxID=1304275 RepID=A0A084IJW0_SALHC|nr:cell division protein ZipA [Salinisphaera hydrothermalis]KEZ76994.1 cell division protein ZipA [Salinisphaera hydrothermalis C41B8]